MGKYITIIITLLLLSGFQACFYSDAEMFEVEPISGDPPLFSVTTNLDTLFNPPVNDSLEVTFSVEISGGEFYYLYADVVNTTVYESDSSFGSFWIYPSLAVSSGVDTLYMEFYYSSNSNSLADKVGYEAIANLQKYAIFFNLEDAQ